MDPVTEVVESGIYGVYTLVFKTLHKPLQEGDEGRDSRHYILVNSGDGDVLIKGEVTF